MQQTKSQTKNWQKTKLGDFVIFNYGKGLPERDRVAGPYPVYGSAGVVDTNKDYLIEGPGIIVGRKGSVGETYYTDKNYFPIDTVYYITKNEEYNLRFLYYLLKTIDFKSLNSDAAVPGLNRNAAYAQEVLLPKTETQRQIADVLSTYDDLIENNTRRIKILEEIAQAIYREWFVHFRFPRLRATRGQAGHEKAKSRNERSSATGIKMIDSKTEFGKIPEEWEVGKVKDIVDLLSGYAFKSGTFVEGGKYKVITIKSVQDGQFKPEGSDTINVAPDKMPEHCYLKNGDILLSLTGNIGRACLVYGEDLLLNQRVAKLDYTKSNRPFVYGLFRNSDFQTQLQNLAIGAAQQNLSPVQTAELTMVIPAVKILDSFSWLVEPMLKEIVELNKQNFILRQVRDLLLPKLVNGEIRI